MTFLPIAKRELRVAAQLSATYRNRAVAAGISGVAVLIVILVAGFNSPGRLGPSLFWILGYFALGFCLLEGIRKTADCISEEKRNGTLGLLFLTDLKGYDIVIGKLAASSINSFFCLIAVLPVLAVPLLMGGVMIAEFWRVALALMNNLFLSLCVGLWVSSWNRDERTALGLSLLLLGTLIGVPLITFNNYIFPLSPVYAFHLADSYHFAASAKSFWEGILITQLISWSLLLWASFLLPRHWQDRQITPRKSGRTNMVPGPFNTALKAQQRREMLNVNPVLWLAARNSRRTTIGVLMALTALNTSFALFVSIYKMDAFHGDSFIVIFIGVCWFINFMTKLRVAVQSCECFAEVRENGALEMLLCTPIKTEQIIDGQLKALSKLFVGPVIAIAVLEIIGLVGTILLETGSFAPNDEVSTLYIIVILYSVLFGLDVFALIWAGMWFGLSSKKLSHAITKNIFLILLLPYCFLLLWFFGIFFWFAAPIFWMVRSNSLLERQLRRSAVGEGINPVSTRASIDYIGKP